MARYVAWRLAQSALVLWAAFTVAFAALYLLPSDPVSIMAAGGGEANAVSDEQIADLQRVHGLDRPLWEQYLDRLGNALTGDFGLSVQTGDPVTEVIAEALPGTLQLAGAALVLAVAGGAGLALLATWTRARWLRQVLLSLPALGVSAPTFWVGLLLVQLVSFRWGLLPAFGQEDWRALVLPAVTLALPTGAVLAQIFARSLRTALVEPYADTARAKGASRARVHFGHAAPNAAVPPLTVTAVLLGNVLSGSVVVETVFSRSGLGRTTAAAVDAQDIPLVLGIVAFGAAVYVVANLLVDLAHPLLDPRVTVGGPAVAA
ncbi:ABC transporter permease [Streptomyces radicis]|uniref:ABC transporter permease n=1 Tax=Streptomyces radicis TaxID=1750517 RepID=A0A3A9W679_9ACTN|nr:ABC transporter permease [Streptomyces radicis]RKN04774.1 ABC transporter permease [Streptomyces radicis]RKN15980.1 ABC transporter permease [Streptomyces radicis]